MLQYAWGDDMDTNASKKYFSIMIILAMLCSCIYLELLATDYVFAPNHTNVLRSTITTSDDIASSQTICTEELLGRHVLLQALRKGRRIMESPRLRLELSVVISVLQQEGCHFLFVQRQPMYHSPVLSTVLIIQYIQHIDGKKSPISILSYC